MRVLLIVLYQTHFLLAVVSKKVSLKTWHRPKGEGRMGGKALLK